MNHVVASDLKVDGSLQCHRCGSTNKTLYPVDIIENGENKKVFMCTVCIEIHDMEVAEEERRQIVREKIRRYDRESGVPGILKNADMVDFTIPVRNPDFKKVEIKRIGEVKDKALKFKEAIAGDSGHMLALIGNVGTGKSLISAAMVNHVIKDQHKRAQFIHAGIISKKMMDNLRYEEILVDIARNHLTIIDDITSASVSDFTRKAMSDIIDTLYVDGRSLIITGNVTARELQEKYIGARGYDRVNESPAGGVVEFSWRSFRGL